MRMFIVIIYSAVLATVMSIGTLTVARQLGVDGTCASKWEKTQDRLSTWPGTGPTTVQQPLDPIQE